MHDTKSVSPEEITELRAREIRGRDAAMKEEVVAKLSKASEALFVHLDNSANAVQHLLGCSEGVFRRMRQGIVPRKNILIPLMNRMQQGDRLGESHSEASTNVYALVADIRECLLDAITEDRGRPKMTALLWRLLHDIGEEEFVRCAEQCGFQWNRLAIWMRSNKDIPTEFYEYIAIMRAAGRIPQQEQKSLWDHEAVVRARLAFESDNALRGRGPGMTNLHMAIGLAQYPTHSTVLEKTFDIAQNTALNIAQYRPVDPDCIYEMLQKLQAHLCLPGFAHTTTNTMRAEWNDEKQTSPYWNLKKAIKKDGLRPVHIMRACGMPHANSHQQNTSNTLLLAVLMHHRRTEYISIPPLAYVVSETVEEAEAIMDDFYRYAKYDLQRGKHCDTSDFVARRRIDNVRNNALPFPAAVFKAAASGHHKMTIDGERQKVPYNEIEEAVRKIRNERIRSVLERFNDQFAFNTPRTLLQTVLNYSAGKLDCTMTSAKREIHMSHSLMKKYVHGSHPIEPAFLDKVCTFADVWVPPVIDRGVQLDFADTLMEAGESTHSRVICAAIAQRYIRRMHYQQAHQMDKNVFNDILRKLRRGTGKPLNYIHHILDPLRSAEEPHIRMGDREYHFIMQVMEHGDIPSAIEEIHMQEVMTGNASSLRDMYQLRLMMFDCITELHQQHAPPSAETAEKQSLADLMEIKKQKMAIWNGKALPVPHPHAPNVLLNDAVKVLRDFPGVSREELCAVGSKMQVEAEIKSTGRCAHE